MSNHPEELMICEHSDICKDCLCFAALPHERALTCNAFFCRHKQVMTRCLPYEDEEVTDEDESRYGMDQGDSINTQEARGSRCGGGLLLL